MDRPFIFKALLACVFILATPFLLWATVPMKEGKKDQLQDESKQKPENKEKPTNNPSPDKADIREVPKARKQARPPVVKPNIKVKPIKVIRPKIKRP
ncbi:hypothetical protein [Pedobacter hiemivivus]|uniref:Uncharacterized protein n=1 Tax=Pedobacter hiemivivus TaxID=2530454 RepID=A0A4R0NBY5_9SPHI|nr:hypothetical protein [Pedobacter hiemivivus]TCC97810.1 hypothetical protein EZ444_07825 [Pedobacter hiemivivus]